MSWLDLLETAIAQDGLTAVAVRLGYAKSSISLARHGRYAGSTAHIAARVLEVYGRWECPHLRQILTASECRSFANRPTPTSNPHALRHWASCQQCPFKDAKS